jgi:hypothetical protein
MASAPTVFVRPLYKGPYAVLRRSCTSSPCTSATGSTRCPPSGGNPAMTQPHRLHSPGPGATRLLPSPSLIFPGDLQGTLCPATNGDTAPGTVFPWPAARGFCTPHCRSSYSRCSAACICRAPNRLNLKIYGLKAWGEPCRGHNCIIPDDDFSLYMCSVSFAHACGDPPPPRDFVR